jgi:hypothetical protein
MESDTAFGIGSSFLIFGILFKDIVSTILGSIVLCIYLIHYILTIRHNYNRHNYNVSLTQNVNSIEESDIEQL